MNPWWRILYYNYALEKCNRIYHVAFEVFDHGYFMQTAVFFFQSSLLKKYNNGKNCGNVLNFLHQNSFLLIKNWKKRIGPTNKPEQKKCKIGTKLAIKPRNNWSFKFKVIRQTTGFVKVDLQASSKSNIARKTAITLLLVAIFLMDFGFFKRFLNMLGSVFKTMFSLKLLHKW